MEKKIKLSPQDVIIKRLEIEKLYFQLRAQEQSVELMERDLKEDIPNKQHRYKIRSTNVEIERLKAEIKIHEKMLREGQQIIEELTKEDLDKFNEEREKEEQ